MVHSIDNDIEAERHGSAVDALHHADTVDRTEDRTREGTDRSCARSACGLSAPALCADGDAVGSGCLDASCTTQRCPTEGLAAMEAVRPRRDREDSTVQAAVQPAPDRVLSVDERLARLRESLRQVAPVAQVTPVEQSASGQPDPAALAEAAEEAARKAAIRNKFARRGAALPPPVVQPQPDLEQGAAENASDSDSAPVPAAILQELQQKQQKQQKQQQQQQQQQQQPQPQSDRDTEWQRQQELAETTVRPSLAPSLILSL